MADVAQVYQRQVFPKKYITEALCGITRQLVASTKASKASTKACAEGTKRL